jgi:hypothetical protein
MAERTRSVDWDAASGIHKTEAGSYQLCRCKLLAPHVGFRGGQDGLKGIRCQVFNFYSASMEATSSEH